MTLISSSLTISNSSTSFPELTTASRISARGDPNNLWGAYTVPSFWKLSWVSSIETAGVAYDWLTGRDFEVSEDMILRSFSENPFFAWGSDQNAIMVPSIGRNLTILEALDVPLSFANLTAIGGNLVFANSRNCHLSFSALTNVSTIWMQNNTNTSLPGNMNSLEFSNNIHLNGHIDT